MPHIPCVAVRARQYLFSMYFDKFHRCMERLILLNKILDHWQEYCISAKKRWTNVGLILSHRLRRWPKFYPTIFQRPVFVMN